MRKWVAGGAADLSEGRGVCGEGPRGGAGAEGRGWSEGRGYEEWTCGRGGGGAGR